MPFPLSSLVVQWMLLSLPAQPCWANQQTNLCLLHLSQPIFSRHNHFHEVGWLLRVGHSTKPDCCWSVLGMKGFLGLVHSFASWLGVPVSQDRQHIWPSTHSGWQQQTLYYTLHCLWKIHNLQLLSTLLCRYFLTLSHFMSCDRACPITFKRLDYCPNGCVHISVHSIFGCLHMWLHTTHVHQKLKRVGSQRPSWASSLLPAHIFISSHCLNDFSPRPRI